MRDEAEMPPKNLKGEKERCDLLGRLSAEVNFLDERTSFTHDEASGRTLTGQRKGTRTSVVYDAAHRIVNQWNLKSDGSVLVGLDYESDPVGNRMRMREATGRLTT